MKMPQKHFSDPCPTLVARKKLPHFFKVGSMVNSLPQHLDPLVNIEKQVEELEERVEIKWKLSGPSNDHQSTSDLKTILCSTSQICVCRWIF